MAKQHEAVDPSAKPSGTGCKECLESDGWWLHLRRCAACGHIGCCDSSPHQHATKHFHATGHEVMASFEPGEDWFWNYTTRSYVSPMPLAPPHAHPADQAVPGPKGKVPADWQSKLG